ncbi:hypothetical protein L195_g022721, partial [Trifolium pratense]
MEGIEWIETVVLVFALKIALKRERHSCFRKVMKFLGLTAILHQF